MEGGHIHEDHPYIVVGILKKTNTSSDNAIFTTIDSVWAVHNSGGQEPDGIPDNVDESHEHGKDELEQEQHDHGGHSHEHGDLTAIVLKTSSLTAQARIVRELSEERGVQGVNPATELRKLLNSVSIGRDLIFAMSAVIILMAVIIIYVSTLSAIKDGKKDIVTMRLIGIKKRTIELILMMQTAFISICALVSAFGGQMLLILIMNNFSSRNFGIILDPWRHYAGEGLLAAIIFVLNLATTFISLIPLYRRDPLEV
jgi:putative ABC transport system permease protein